LENNQNLQKAWVSYFQICFLYIILNYGITSLPCADLGLKKKQNPDPQHCLLLVSYILNVKIIVTSFARKCNRDGCAEKIVFTREVEYGGGLRVYSDINYYSENMLL